MKKTGHLAALGAAFIFGFSPILGKLSYAGGSNGASLTFWRSALALPFLYFLMRHRSRSFRIPLPHLRATLLTGVFGTAATTLLHFTSYAYIDVGVSTALHFFYPVVVTLASALLFHERITKAKGWAVLLGFAGVACLMDLAQPQNLLGIALALASAFTYAIYMLSVQYSPLRHMDGLTMAFYLAIANLSTAGVFALASGQFTLSLTPLAWLYTIIIALMLAVVAMLLFNYAIQTLGASTTALLSILEPVICALLGALLLGEQLHAWSITGLICMSSSVWLISRNNS